MKIVLLNKRDKAKSLINMITQSLIKIFNTNYTYENRNANANDRKQHE